MPGAERTRDAPTSPPLVLVVDNHQDSADVCATYLRLMGFAVVIASSAAEAIQIAFTRIPDAIITDLAMPVMDGWAIVQAVRANAHTKDVPIVVLTGYVDAQTRQRAVDEGCNAFLEKPCSPPDLVTLLQTLVGRQASP